ncbi:MAG: hypothetical protein JXQ96_22580 [Cyclobacteriaceae bacterium]
MVRCFTLVFICLFCSYGLAFSQDEDESFDEVVEHFDELDKEWHTMEPTLSDYEGLHTYCSQRTYKERVQTILSKLHHYDTVIINKMNDASYVIDNKERSKILRSIRKFEEEYSIPKFLEKIDQECHERHDVEHDKKYTKNDFADNSYSGQKLIVELEIKKYMKHITNKIDYIDKYLHHLHISEIKL